MARLRRLLRHPLSWVLAAVLVVALGIGLWLFQPWRLFTNKTVNEELTAVQTGPPATAAPGATPDATAPAAAPRMLSQGTFITHEHDTSGTVRVIQQPDGKRTLEIASLSTSDGPDLRVWLTDQEVKPGRAGWGVFDDGKYVELGRLKGNRGNQVYPIPDGADLGQYRSVSIWCKRFSVSFGAAELTPA